MKLKVNNLYMSKRNQASRKRVYPAGVRTLARVMGWLGVALALAAFSAVAVQSVLGCGLVEGCSGGVDIKWSARIAITGLLLGYMGFLDK